MRYMWLMFSTVLMIASTSLADPQGDFDLLFGDEARKVALTSSKLDDVAFARKLLDAAKAIPDSPKMQIFLYEKAYEFGMRFKTGYGTAAEALTALAKAVPEDQKAQWRDKQLNVYRLQYAAASTDEKPEAAKPLVEMLVTEAEAKVKAGDTEDGLEVYRQALGICTYVRSDRADEIRDRVEEIMIEVRRRQKLQKLTDALTADPGNVKVRKELILFYLVEMDQPEKAVELCGDGALEEDLRRLVPLTVKDIDELEQQQCAQLGKWYAETVYPAVSASAKAEPLRRALACYARYLTLHEEKDINRYRAQVAHKRIQTLLDSLTSSETAEPSVGAVFLTPKEVQAKFGLGDDSLRGEPGTVAISFGDIATAAGIKKLLVPLTARACGFGFKIKAPAYQIVGAFIDGKDWQYSRGHWHNSGGYFVAGGTIDRRKGRETVTKPGEWHSMEMSFSGRKVIFRYNGREVASGTVPGGAGKHQIVPYFSSHESAVLIKDVYLRSTE